MKGSAHGAGVVVVRVPRRGLQGLGAVSRGASPGAATPWAWGGGRGGGAAAALASPIDIGAAAHSVTASAAAHTTAAHRAHAHHSPTVAADLSSDDGSSHGPTAAPPPVQIARRYQPAVRTALTRTQPQMTGERRECSAHREDLCSSSWWRGGEGERDEGGRKTRNGPAKRRRAGKERAGVQTSDLHLTCGT